MKCFFYLQKNWETLLAAILGFFAIIISTRYSGIGVSPDSVVYASVARNFHAGKGFVELSGIPIVQFPLFFPVFLAAVFLLTGIDPIITAPYLNGILFSIVIFCCGKLADQLNVKSPWYKRFLLILVVLSPSLLEIYKMIWSETLFILLSLLFLFQWQNYVRFHQPKHLLTLALIAALALVTRYAGITLVFTGCLLLLIDPALAFKQKIKHFFLFGFTAISLLILNLLRNALILGTVTGNRQKGTTTLTENLQFYGTTISGWLTIPETYVTIAFFIGIISLTLFLILFWMKCRNKAAIVSTENVLVCFFLTYAGFIIITSTISRYETINNRLLAPAFIPFLFGGSSWLVRILKKYRQKQYKLLSYFLFLLTILFISRSFYVDYQQYQEDTTSGIPGYSDDSWNKSEMVAFLKKHKEVFKPSLKIFSNDSAGMYFITGFKTLSIPDRHYQKEIKEYTSNKHHYLIWFNQTEDEELLSLNEIKQIKQLTLLYQFKDGAIYQSF
ncbi:hypothetical protein [Mucilaginibacter arboris]|uniref:Glycosyltransferase RgtA/B/C/D-like domain-containing protein n=1 Tax=Mucilaginibacter arboris TaxID=2682090 RepID=A0A7K1SYR0_9SPHI|nr:hypothetical protein [Mucilaginibacter arboris]MVN22170.1 hypothetical protein [Mucilaginibacter arboris]